MGAIFLRISDELERRFRKTVLERLGGKQGDLSKAGEQAIKLWLKEAGK